MKTLTLALILSAAVFGSTDVATTSYPVVSTSCEFTLAKDGQTTQFVCTDSHVKEDGTIVEKTTVCKNPVPTMWSDGITSVSCADKVVNANRANIKAAVEQGVKKELDRREHEKFLRDSAEMSRIMRDIEMQETDRMFAQMVAYQERLNHPSFFEQHSGSIMFAASVLLVGFYFLIALPDPFAPETFQSECKLSDGTELGTVGNRNKKHGWKYAIRDKDEVVEVVEVGHEIEDLTDFSEAHKYPAYVAAFDDNDSPWYIETRDREIEPAIA